MSYLEEEMQEVATGLVAYADNEEELLSNWPEAHNIDVSYVDEYTFTERFAKPEWFEE